jgi:L-fuculose-phosphate aldolase
MSETTALRQAIVDVCRRMYEKGFLAATDGNVSARLGDRLFVTPSGISKGHMAPEQLIVTDLSGRVLEGEARPSSELAMHLAAYRARPDVQAVVHAHPPRAIAFTVAGVPIPGRVLPEVVVTLGGEIPTVPYTTPTTEEVPQALGPYFERHDAVMMEWHGAVCLGPDVWDAYYKLEKLEHLCEVALFAQQLGGWRELSERQLGPLMDIRARMHQGQGATTPPVGC